MTVYGGGSGVSQNIMIDDKEGGGGLELAQKMWHNIWIIPNALCDILHFWINMYIYKRNLLKEGSSHAEVSHNMLFKE